MKCPNCGENTAVKDSSFNPETNEYYRKRKCSACDLVYFTVEFEVECNERFERDWRNNHRHNSFPK